MNAYFMDGPTDRQMNGQTDGRMDELSFWFLFVNRHFYNIIPVPGAALASLGFALFHYSSWRFKVSTYSKTNSCLFK